MRKNLQLLIGLFSIICVYCLAPISANSMPDSSSSVTHSTVTSQGRFNYDYLDQVPERASTATGRITESPQDDATHLTNIILPKIPISTRSIIKRSMQGSRFPNKIHYSNNNGLMHSINSCKDDKGLCNMQVFNNEGFQHIRDFKLHNELQWNKEDYKDYNDKETYIPGLNDINIVLPYNNKIGSSNSHTYHAHPSQNPNTISDVYAQTPVSNNRVVLPFNKPSITDLIQQLLSVNHNMQQDPLTTSHDNAVDELEPIQVKKNSLQYHGWGPKGMPFNVLYMKPALKYPVVKAERMVPPAPLTGFPTTGQHPQVTIQTTPRTGNRRGGRKIRRQYSVIPHLFVSYGWESRGK
jgi:hypothetical protein